MRVRCFRWILIILALCVQWSAFAQTPDATLPGSSDTITANADAVTIRNLPSGRGTAAIEVSNMCSCTLAVQGRTSPSLDWEAVDGAPNLTADGIYYITAAGLSELRVVATAYTSGTATIGIRVSSAGGGSGGGGASGVAGTVDIEFSGVVPDLGIGTTGTATLRTAIDTAQWDTIDAVEGNTADTASRLLDLLNSLSSAAHFGDDVTLAGDLDPIACETGDIDGSAQPNVTTETKYNRVRCTLGGAFQVALTNEDGTALPPVVIEDAAETAGGGLMAVGAVVRTSVGGSTGTNNENATFNVDGLGRLWARDGGPCADPARITSAAISESTGATNEIVALNGSDLIYVCSYKWVTTAANSLSWVRGTGSDCGTGTTAIEGAQPFAANGGVAEDGGGAPLFVVAAGNALCLTSSTATAHGGRVSYVRTAAP